MLNSAKAAGSDNGQGNFVKTVLENYFKEADLRDKRVMVASLLRSSKPKRNLAAKKKTAMEEADRFEALEEESRHMLGDPESLVVELIPQCVSCPKEKK